MVPPCQIKALQKADILQGTCPTIVPSPSIHLITATESGNCPLHVSNYLPGAVFSHITLYTWSPQITEDIEKLNILHVSGISSMWLHTNSNFPHQQDLIST